MQKSKMAAWYNTEILSYEEIMSFCVYILCILFGNIEPVKNIFWISVVMLWSLVQ